MKTQDIDDETTIFLTDDLEVGVVVHEEHGDQLRLEGESLTFDEIDVAYHIQQNEPATLADLKEVYDVDVEKIKKTVDELHERGEVYQPDEGEYRIVPEE